MRCCNCTASCLPASLAPITPLPHLSPTPTHTGWHVHQRPPQQPAQRRVVPGRRPAGRPHRGQRARGSEHSGGKLLPLWLHFLFAVGKLASFEATMCLPLPMAWIIAAAHNLSALHMAVAHGRQTGCLPLSLHLLVQVPTAGQGLWPQFWLAPLEDAYGAWPASGEVRSAGLDVLVNRLPEPSGILFVFVCVESMFYILDHGLFTGDLLAWFSLALCSLT